MAVSPDSGRRYWAGVFIKGPDRTGGVGQARPRRSRRTTARRGPGSLPLDRRRHRAAGPDVWAALVRDRAPDRRRGVGELPRDEGDVPLDDLGPWPHVPVPRPGPRLGRQLERLEDGHRHALSRPSGPSRARTSRPSSRWRAKRGQAIRVAPTNRAWAVSASTNASTNPGAASGSKPVSHQTSVMRRTLSRRSARGSMRPTRSVPEQQRQDVVAPPTLGARHVDLPDVVEVVQRAQQLAIPHERIERPEERHAAAAGPGWRPSSRPPRASAGPPG